MALVDGVTTLLNFQAISDIIKEPNGKLHSVNEYVLINCVGSGSFSKVYKGYNQITKEIVAVKKIRFDIHRSNLNNIQREIANMRSLDHPNILKLHDVLYDQDNELIYMILDFSTQGSLQHILNSGRQITTGHALSIIQQISKALLYIHSKSIVHKDVKPSNILLMNDGRAVLADFGTACSFENSNLTIGTPAYQAPEALEDDAEIDWTSQLIPPKEDVWALGITLYQMLFNHLPYSGGNIYEIVHNIEEFPLEIPECALEIRILLLGMLDKNPSKRWSMSAVYNYPLVQQAEPMLPSAQLSCEQYDFDEVELLKTKAVPWVPRSFVSQNHSSESMAIQPLI